MLCLTSGGLKVVYSEEEEEEKKNGSARRRRSRTIATCSFVTQSYLQNIYNFVVVAITVLCCISQIFSIQ